MKISGIVILIAGVLLLSGCNIEKAISPPKCQKGEVNLDNYTEKGKRMGNCFVEYPGEATRQDKSYYIVEDICGQFTNEFVSNALGRKILKSQKSDTNDVFACSYSWNERNDYVSLVLDYNKIETQKAGQEILGRKVEEDNSIPMKNMVVYQDNGLINTIYLILGDEKYISIERSASAGLTSDDLLNFAANIAKEIKNYK